MGEWSLRAAGALYMAIALAFGPALASDKRPLIFLGDRDLAPYEFLVNGVPRGANVDLAHAIGRVLGRDVEVRLMDWAEAQKLVREGQADVLTLLAQTPEREAHYDFTQSTLPIAFALFIRTTDEDEVAGRPPAEAFRGMRIGVTRAGLARSLLEKQIPDAELVTVDNLLDGTRRLVSGEIDAFAGQVWSQSFLIRELGLRGLMSLPPLFERASNMAVRKGDTQLLADLDRALTELKASGELDQIVRRWSSTRLRLVSESTLITLTAVAAVAAATLVILLVGLGWSRRQKGALQREVDERRRAEVALRESQLALQSADRSKDRFIATLAHELRNPLAPISNAVYLLEAQGDETPQARWAREVIGRQTRHLARLIDDLLDVGRITSGKLELRRAPTPLSAMLDEAIEVSRPAIERGGHRLRVSAPPDPVWLDVDRTRLVQAVMNLLTNAAKYTPRSDDIHLAATVRERDLTVCVRDAGVGIPAEQLADVFEMFHQEQRARVHSQEGLGIGLWLTRQLVELHGGSITAHSEGSDRGSEFVVSLPGVVCPAPGGTDRAAVARAPSRSDAKILVVDDNVDAACTTARLLAASGFDVAHAHDGARALEHARRDPPDAVILDLAMPGLDGYAVCAELRQAGAAGPAIIALSGWGAATDKALTSSAGFDAHLVKPVDRSELLQTIERLIAARRSAHRGEPSGALGTAPQSNASE